MEKPIERGNSRRKISYAKVTKDQLPPHILTESEEEAVGKLIIRSTSEKETHIPMGSTRSEQIYARIEIITAKGAQSRRKMGASFTDQDWFQPERQREIKKTLLNRCKAAMKTGMRYV